MVLIVMIYISKSDGWMVGRTEELVDGWLDAYENENGFVGWIGICLIDSIK